MTQVAEPLKSPARRSMGDRSAFMTTEWRHLLMLNYEIDPAVLEPRVPAGTELDIWRGKAFVSLVGFLYRDARIWGVGWPWHQNFAEVNLRYYVRRQVGDELRRGVVFLKEIVPRRLVAAIARYFYNENFVVLPLSSDIRPSRADDIESSATDIEYRWPSDGRMNRLYGRITGPARPCDPDSEEEFITAHYWGYVRARDGRTTEYQVEHEPWRVWHAQDARFDCDVRSTYGAEFMPALLGEPSSALVAEGSPVWVYRGTKI